MGLSYAEAFAALTAIADERGDSVTLRIEGWRHNDSHGARSTIEWSIYSCARDEHYTARTPEGAIARYRSDHASGPGPATTEALESVGAASVPGCDGPEMMPLDPEDGEAVSL